jgi:hypothetical protein
MASGHVWLTWAQAPGTVTRYRIMQQVGDASAPWEYSGLTYDTCATSAPVLLPPCKPIRFQVVEMAGNAIVRSHTPDVWQEWCGNPDIDGDGVVGMADWAKQGRTIGRRREGDEWVK